MCIFKEKGKCKEKSLIFTALSMDQLFKLDNSKSKIYIRCKIQECKCS